MEDIRSTSNEENLESPEAREEVEALDETTNEAEAYVEKTRSYEQAEAVEGALVDMVKGSEEEVVRTPINQPKEIAMDEEPPHSLEANEVGSAAGLVAKEDPSPDPTPPDQEGMQVLEEEAILREAPSEMPPEMEMLESEEVVAFKFFKPVPAEEDLTAYHKSEPDLRDDPTPPGPEPDFSSMVKGELNQEPERGMEPEPPDPDPDIHESGMDPDPVDAGTPPSQMPPEMEQLNLDEVVGMKFRPGEEVSGSISPGIDQVSKIDSFTREGELSEPVISEDIPDLESPPIADISDEVSKDPAYLEASERKITDIDSSPPEGDEIEEGG